VNNPKKLPPSSGYEWSTEKDFYIDPPKRNYYGKEANYMDDNLKELSAITNAVNTLIAAIKEQQLTLEAHSEMLDEITAALADGN